MYNELLKKKLTVEQIVRTHISKDDRSGIKSGPFWYYNSFWEELKGQLQECDDNSAIGKFIIVVQNCSKLRVIFKR